VQQGVPATGRDRARQVVQLELEGIRLGVGITAVVVLAIAVAVAGGRGGIGGDLLLLVLGHALPDDGLDAEIPANEQAARYHLAQDAGYRQSQERAPVPASVIDPEDGRRDQPE
jgi:hypothetical protein